MLGKSYLPSQAWLCPRTHFRPMSPPCPSATPPYLFPSRGGCPHLVNPTVVLPFSRQQAARFFFDSFSPLRTIRKAVCLSGYPTSEGSGVIRPKKAVPSGSLYRSAVSTFLFLFPSSDPLVHVLVSLRNHVFSLFSCPKNGSRQFPLRFGSPPLSDSSPLSSCRDDHPTPGIALALLPPFKTVPAPEFRVTWRRLVFICALSFLIPHCRRPCWRLSSFHPPLF